MDRSLPDHEILQLSTCYNTFYDKIIYFLLGKNSCDEDISWFVGDGFCDDETNNEDCNFDGGDCCLDFVGK